MLSILIIISISVSTSTFAASRLNFREGVVKSHFILVHQVLHSIHVQNLYRIQVVGYNNSNFFINPITVKSNGYMFYISSAFVPYDILTFIYAVLFFKLTWGQ